MSDFRPVPKPEKPIRGTVAAKAHMEKVAKLPCVICRFPQVQLHHCSHDRYAQRRASDFEVIPLCVKCHDKLTNSKAQWRIDHGPDHGYLDFVAAQIDTRIG